METLKCLDWEISASNAINGSGGMNTIVRISNKQLAKKKNPMYGHDDIDPSDWPVLPKYFQRPNVLFYVSGAFQQCVTYSGWVAGRVELPQSRGSFVLLLFPSGIA